MAVAKCNEGATQKLTSEQRVTRRASLVRASGVCVTSTVCQSKVTKNRALSALRHDRRDASCTSFGGVRPGFVACSVHPMHRHVLSPLLVSLAVVGMMGACAKADENLGVPSEGGLASGGSAGLAGASGASNGGTSGASSGGSSGASGSPATGGTAGSASGGSSGSSSGGTGGTGGATGGGGAGGTGGGGGTGGATGGAGGGVACDSNCNLCNCPSTACTVCCAQKQKVDVCTAGKCGCF